MTGPAGGGVMTDRKQIAVMAENERLRLRLLDRDEEIARLRAEVERAGEDLSAERQRNAPLRARIKEQTDRADRAEREADVRADSAIASAIALWRESNVRFQRRAEQAEAWSRAWKAGAISNKRAYDDLWPRYVSVCGDLDAAKAALAEIVQAIGPHACECCCEGQRVEVERALSVARAALGQGEPAP